MEVEFYIEMQPKRWQEILESLRSILLECDLQETIRYRLPFYDYQGMCCYLNARKKDVVLGFAYGAALSDPDGVFADKKQQVAHMIYADLGSIDKKEIVSMVKKAKEFNELKQR